MFSSEGKFPNIKMVCEHCGSYSVSSRYVHDSSGEVVGKAHTCLTCGNYDSGY